MIWFLLLLEGAFTCFVLLLVCVVGIANGPVGLVNLYEKDVQQRVVALGYTTEKRIRRNEAWASAALLLPLLIFVPLAVYGLNGARGFWEGFWQMTVILWINGFFDRLFIDWYWVEHSKAWLIPGTEDLQPYIPPKTRALKWTGTLLFYPLVAAALAWILSRVLG